MIVQEMHIQYLGHSGFLIELENCYLIFDYWKGKVPKLNEEKPLFVFVSHRHHDHYSRKIWEFRNRNGETTYILAKEIPFSKKQQIELGLLTVEVENQKEKMLYYEHPLGLKYLTKVIRLAGREEIEVDKNLGLMVETLISTDIGVAFYVEVENKKIYHAGDLNNWIWEGQIEEANIVMEKDYLNELNYFANKSLQRKIDVAFLPLDPRQGEIASKGLLQFLDTILVENVIPMHLWGEYDFPKKILSKVASKIKENKFFFIDPKKEIIE